MQRQRAAVIGAGYIGNVHVECLLRIGVQVVAICDPNQSAAQKSADRFGIPEVFTDPTVLLDECEVDVVHVCTPNNTHFELNKMILEQKIPVVSEKPLAISSAESAELLEMSRTLEIPTAVNFNYRYYPVVQHAYAMVKDGELGKPNIVQGHYLQDWLFYDTDYNWRLDTEIGGASRAMADIGSHWCDLAQFVSGLKIIEVFAELKTVHQVRKKPKGEVKTFSKSASSAYEEKEMSTEDYAAVLVRFENGAVGNFTVSQVSAGRKCDIRLDVYGSRQSLSWEHDNSNELWIGHRDQPAQIVLKDPGMLNERGAQFAHYPGGHPEGYPSVPMNLFSEFYQGLREGNVGSTVPSFFDGHNQVLVTEAVLKSSRESVWVQISE